MSSRPQLLYLTPVMPALGGNGLAMRAGAVLRALAPTHDVSLLVVRLYAPYRGSVPPEFTRVCVRAEVVTPDDGGRPQALRALLTRLGAPAADGGGGVAEAFAGIAFDVVHVFRLAMVPHARPYLDGPHRPLRHLDLDDVESVSRRRIADLMAANGDVEEAARERAAARDAQERERAALRDFDRVYVCSDTDRERLEGAGAEVRVLPNAVAPVGDPSPAPRRLPITFLFVGTLGYYPNEDAARWLCGEVLPELRRTAPLPFRLVLVGSGPSDAVRALDALPEVTVAGPVPDVEPWYRDADAVVVPVRAGGGTRIKVLEAFAHRRAVVSTAVGAEGIAVRDGEHLLIADGAADFARACVRMMTDAALRASLVDAAHRLVSERYSLAAMRAVIGGASWSPPCRPC